MRSKSENNKDKNSPSLLNKHDLDFSYGGNYGHDDNDLKLQK